MRLHLSTWQEVETYLKTSKAILIPIGSTEQHGPTGLIGTDALCPEIIGGLAADESGREASAFLVAKSDDLYWGAESLTGFVQTGHALNSREDSERAVVFSGVAYRVEVRTDKNGTCARFEPFVSSDEIAHRVDSGVHPSGLHPCRHDRVCCLVL